MRMCNADTRVAVSIDPFGCEGVVNAMGEREGCHESDPTLGERCGGSNGAKVHGWHGQARSVEC